MFQLTTSTIIDACVHADIFPLIDTLIDQEGEFVIWPVLPEGDDRKQWVHTFTQLILKGEIEMHIDTELPASPRHGGYRQVSSGYRQGSEDFSFPTITIRFNRIVAAGEQFLFSTHPALSFELPEHVLTITLILGRAVVYTCPLASQKKEACDDLPF